MTKLEFEWIAFNGGEAYVPKGAGPDRRVAYVTGCAAWIGGYRLQGVCNKLMVRDIFATIASALATPASDGLPEGRKATETERVDGRLVYRTQDLGWATRPTKDYSYADRLGPDNMSLPEACLATNERFPVASAPAKGVSNERIERCKAHLRTFLDCQGSMREDEVIRAILDEAANERFPVVKPEAPAKWVQNNQWCWQRSADRSLVHRMSDVGLWGFIVNGKTLAAFPIAEEAMAWADRERPVA